MLDVWNPQLPAFANPQEKFKRKWLMSADMCDTIANLRYHKYDRHVGWLSNVFDFLISGAYQLKLLRKIIKITVKTYRLKNVLCSQVPIPSEFGCVMA